MAEPRPMTETDCREKFLAHIRSIVDYWADESCDTKRKLDGVAFSILVAIDGEAGDLPAFRLSPKPHEDAREYHKRHGQNWWPEDGVNIAGSLHDDFHQTEPEETAASVT